MALGLVVVYLFIAHSGLDTTPWELIPGLLLVGAGMALIMAPIFAVVLTDVDPKHAGSASGVLSAVQQLGGAIGIALIGVVFFGQLSSHAAQSFDSVTPHIRSSLTTAHVPAAEQEQIIASAKTCYVDRTSQKDTSLTPQSCKKLESNNTTSNLSATQRAAQAKIGSIIADQIKHANTNNFVDGFRVAVIFEGIILAIVFVLSFLLPRHIKPEAFEEMG
jgi:hypothetical protein